MSAPSLTRTAHDSSVRPVPALKAGDHLDQPTFHERYHAMPPHFRAELIEGVVVVPSPVGYDHGKTHAMLVGWLNSYCLRTPGVDALDNTSTILGPATEVQPDAILISALEDERQAKAVGGYLHGAPEFVVEVSVTTTSQDLGPKKREYERAGVLEYLVVMPLKPEIKWFRREGDFLMETAPDTRGIYRSLAFPGLWLDSQALLVGDRFGIHQALEQGLATPEHEAFSARRRPRP